LVKEKDYYAFYIESDIKKFKELELLAEKFPKINAINAFVSANDSDPAALDNILKGKCPKVFDVLSIDIDSYDLDIWESFRNFDPNIVVIEINSSVLPGIEYRHSAQTPGNTFSSTLKVGKNKGYTLVCHTGNIIFVKTDLIEFLNMPQDLIDYPEKLFNSSFINP
jgi:hypothetical protein